MDQMTARFPGRATPWWREVGPAEWKALIASGSGWMLDAMDVMLYAFALSAIRDEFGLSGAQAGALASVTLLSSAFGGIGFGILADRYGRARMLQVAILVYSLCTALTATAGSVLALVLWRTLVGIGLGGEWSAGSVLVAETWPTAHRGKAIGIMQSGWAVGYMLAAGLAALVMPRFGWRPLFLVGVLPALLAFWIRRHVPEPAQWRPGEATTSPFRGIREMFRGALLRRTLVATGIATFLMFAYWGLFTWVPSFLAAPVDQGGAGMGVVRSTGWIIPMQIGALAGYLSFGFLADRAATRVPVLRLERRGVGPSVRRGRHSPRCVDAPRSGDWVLRPRVLQRLRIDVGRALPDGNQSHCPGALLQLWACCLGSGPDDYWGDRRCAWLGARPRDDGPFLHRRGDADAAASRNEGSGPRLVLRVGGTEAAFARSQW